MHRGQPGLESTKSRSRMAMFWPTMNRDITEKLLSCSVCNSTWGHQQREPLLFHPGPELPWSTVPTNVLLVDSCKGWFEVNLLHNVSSATVISKLKCHFSVHGSPHTLISDNIRNYTSQQFQVFADQWDFCMSSAVLTTVRSLKITPQKGGNSTSSQSKMVWSHQTKEILP